ncbi:MAG: PAS domain S-box protein [Chloroflexi bacterium]|nr:PAS domain S-box protein [Chloroflexota bacterium]
MAVSARSTFWKNTFDRLIRPSPRIAHESERQQARILAALSIALLIALAIIAPIWIVTATDFHATPFISLGLVAAFILIYALSRSRYYYLGAVLLIAAMLLMVIATLVTAPGTPTERMPTLMYLVIAVMLSSLFLKRWVTILVTLSSALMISVFFFVPGIAFSFPYAYLVFLLLFTILGAVGALLRNDDQRKLAQSEARYRSMFEENQAIKLLIDPESGLIVDANSAAASFYGYPLDVLKTLRIQQINTLSEPEIEAEMALARSEQRAVFNFRHRLASGDIRDVEVFSGPVNIEGKVQLFSIVVDATARRRAEDSLRQSEARHRALLKTIPDLVFRNHTDGTFLDYHAPDANDLALPPEQFMGRKIQDVMPPEFAELQLRAQQRLMETRQEQSYEYSLPLHGQSMDYEARMVLSGDDEFLTIIRNITERKQAQQRAFDLALEQERVHLLRQFIESASHEFRTPLSVISSSTYLITKLEDIQKRELRAADIKAQVARMNRLVDMLLTLSRLESEAPVPFSQVNVASLIDIVCEALVSQYGPKPTLHYERPADLPSIPGDPHDLSEAFLQIVDNAYRFTPPTGTITITAAVAEGLVWIAISDTGAGIAAENLPHIFESFWRLDQAHTTPGFGLGLPIAQRVIDLHGGRIEVESEVGKGTTVRIGLRLASDDTTAARR